jgi:hypothetical protein
VRLAADPRGDVRLRVGASRSALPHEEFKIGRAFTNRIVVDGRDVHRTHVSLRFHPDGWHLHDHSTRGVVVDGVVRRDGPWPVFDGFTFAMGHAGDVVFVVSAPRTAPLDHRRPLQNGWCAYGVAVDDDGAFATNDDHARRGHWAFSVVGGRVRHGFVAWHARLDRRAPLLAAAGVDGDGIPVVADSWDDGAMVARVFLLAAGVTWSQLHAQPGAMPTGIARHLARAAAKTRSACAAVSVDVHDDDLWLGFDGRLSYRAPQHLGLLLAGAVADVGVVVDVDARAAHAAVAALLAGMFPDERRAWDDLVEQLAIAGA